jgi:hypothetical protein
MLSLGLVRRPGPASGRSDPGYLASRELSADVPPAAAARQMRWKTGFGFELGGPVDERARVPEASAVAKCPGTVILWRRDGERGRVVVAANGHSVRLPDSAGVVRLLERLAAGETVAVSPRSAEERTRISETRWNPRLELETRSLVTRRKPDAWLAGWLLRVHAVETR